jgi:hypothetical protein
MEKVPGIYQVKDGERIPVSGGYVLLDEQTVGFRIRVCGRMDIMPRFPNNPGSVPQDVS